MASERQEEEVEPALRQPLTPVHSVDKVSLRSVMATSVTVPAT